jgi:hypothetical protein
MLTIDADRKHIEAAYKSQLGDVVVFSDEEVYAGGPFGWEIVRFGGKPITDIGPGS